MATTHLKVYFKQQEIDYLKERASLLGRSLSDFCRIIILKNAERESLVSPELLRLDKPPINTTVPIILNEEPLEELVEVVEDPDSRNAVIRDILKNF